MQSTKQGFSTLNGLGDFNKMKGAYKISQKHKFRFEHQSPEVSDKFDNKYLSTLWIPKEIINSSTNVSNTQKSTTVEPKSAVKHSRNRRDRIGTFKSEPHSAMISPNHYLSQQRRPNLKVQIEPVRIHLVLPVCISLWHRGHILLCQLYFQSKFRIWMNNFVFSSYKFDEKFPHLIDSLSYRSQVR